MFWFFLKTWSQQCNCVKQAKQAKGSASKGIEGISFKLYQKYALCCTPNTPKSHSETPLTLNTGLAEKGHRWVLWVGVRRCRHVSSVNILCLVWQEVSVETLTRRWSLRPVGLLLLLIPTLRSLYQMIHTFVSFFSDNFLFTGTR